jgi:Pyruvate/2-oxoacid:ferredoxin oxidoreductase gamma subunit
MSAVNDFTIQVATVNGSGSNTANLVLLRSIFQMGVPVSGKNLFPSNIAGLPTWFTIRANHRGYIARKKEIDLLVAMNAETAREDVLSLEPGCTVVYDEPLKLNALRDDLEFYPVPFDKIVAEVCPDAKLRKLVKNMIYDGVLAYLLSIDLAEMEKALGKQPARSRRRCSSIGARCRRPEVGERKRQAVGEVQGRAARQDGRQDSVEVQRGRTGLPDGRRHRRVVVPDHAVLVVVRDVDRLPAQVPHGREDRQGHVLGRAGRRRDRRDRHGHRRQLGRCACDDLNVGPGRVAHV